jgi:hypothetical protein
MQTAHSGVSALMLEHHEMSLCDYTISCKHLGSTFLFSSQSRRVSVIPLLGKHLGDGKVEEPSPKKLFGTIPTR